ncbi:unnamed protein product [Calypogeia fissa]
MKAEYHGASERRLRKALKDSKDKDRESSAMLRTVQAENQKLVVELNEQKQKADAQIESLTSHKTSEDNETDDARTEKMQYQEKLGIALLEKEDVEKKLVLIKGERDAALVALAKQKAQVMKLGEDLATALTTTQNLAKELENVELDRGATRLELDRQKVLVIQEQDDMLKMQTTLINEQTKLESDIFLIRENVVEDKRRLVKAHNDAMDDARTEIDHLKIEIQHFREEKNRWEKLDYGVSLM